VIKTTDISFAYSGSELLSFPEIRCNPSESHLILGPSGCGKTTLLHLLGGLLRPKTGEIQINDVPIERMSGMALDKFRGQNIGIVFQRAHFMRALTVEENLMLGQKLAGMKVDKLKALQTLDRLGIGHKATASTNNLSAGERQRVVIARAIINDPKVILADEPTSALDDNNCQLVYELLVELSREEGAALIIVTHDKRLKDRIPNHTILRPLL
jgi:putative ABC transport system ATP-binding protein